MSSSPTATLSMVGGSPLSNSSSISNNTTCSVTYTPLAPRHSIPTYNTQHRQSARQPGIPGIIGSVAGLSGISDPVQLLHKVRQLGAPDLSTALRLDPSILLNDAGSEELCREPSISETSFGRRGQHLCLFCHRLFSSAALYASHLQRPVARIIYRCHLCPNISACQTVIVPALNDSATRDPSGLLSATNLCALYAHMALRHGHTHPNPADWRLVNSRLSVTSLPWKTRGPLEYAHGDGNQGHDGIGKKGHRSSICIDLETGVDVSGASGDIETSQPNQFAFPIYVDGQELVDLRNDLDRTVTGLLRTNEFQFLPGVTSSSLQRRRGGFASLLRMPDVRAMATNPVFLPSSNPPDSLSSNVVGLPSPGSPRAHLILRLAEASLWHGHFFLCGWNPEIPFTTPSNIASPEVTLDKDISSSNTAIEKPSNENQDVQMVQAERPTGEKEVILEQVSPNLVPSAASNEQLREAETAFICDQSVVSPTALPVWQSLLCPPSSFTTVGGLLRCLVCGNFRTNNPTELAAHLGGIPPSVPGKCALCTQSVAYNKANLCSVKAHLLFHLGIYLMCPQCGFTPPPDLPPDLAELCLRVHMRFICFHFNVVQVYLCLRPECRGKAYMTQHLFVQHWMDSHTLRRFACLLCHRAKCEETGESGERQPTTTTTSMDNATTLVSGRTVAGGSISLKTSSTPTPPSLLLPSAEAHKFPDNASIRRHLEQEHQVTEVQLTLATVGNFYASGFVCSECGYVSATSIAFATHFSAVHCRAMTSTITATSDASSSSVAAPSSPCDAQCFFRCFGNCKRIHNDLTDFRAHQLDCPASLRLLSATYGPLFRLSTPSISAELEAEGGGGSGFSGGNPLCFCLYCGIGSRRHRGHPTVTTTSSQTTSSQLSMPPPRSVSPVPESPLDCFVSSEQQQPQQQPITSNSNNLSTSSTAAASVIYATSTFSDLEAVHAHERREHMACEGNRQIGCPWCPLRQECSKPEHLQLILDHLSTHTKANPYISWYLHRRNQLQNNLNDMVLCYCATGLLDCPMALMAHATCEPTTSTTLCGRKRNQLLSISSNALLGVGVDDGEDDEEEGRDKTTHHDACSHSHAIRPPLQPSNHVPCSPAVYNHLRFGEYPYADALLKHYATGAQREFLCPLCSTIEMTRWALTEHAFNFHWTRLCFICCDYVHTETNTIVEEPAVSTSHLLGSVDVIEHGAGDSREDSTIAPPFANISKKRKPSFWDHVYVCLTKRHHKLLALHKSEGKEGVMSGDEVGNKATVEDEDGEEEEEEEENLSTLSLGNGVANVESELGDPPSVGVSIMAMCDETRPSSKMQASVAQVGVVSKISNIQKSIDESNGTEDNTHPTPAKIPRLDEENEKGDLEEGGATSKAPTNFTAYKKLFRGCFLCGVKCTWDAYEEHMMSHQNPYTGCDTLLHDPTKNSLTNERPAVYKCYICYRRFLEKSTCKHHMLVRHRLQKNDLHWSKLIESSQTIDVHEASPPLGVFPVAAGMFTCAQCFEEFKTRRLLRLHVTEKHPLKENGWQPVYCSECGLSFLSELSLRIHKRGAHHQRTSASIDVALDEEESTDDPKEDGSSKIILQPLIL